MRSVPPRIDAIDLNILEALQADGRITKLKLAEAVNLSPSACFERLRRLEKEGYIRGYVAEVDPGRVVHTTLALVEITLERHAAEDFARFEEEARKVDEIVECYSIGGGIDYILKVVAVDIEHYEAVIERLLGAGLGIARYFTYFVTKPVKRRLDWPIRTLLSVRDG